MLNNFIKFVFFISTYFLNISTKDIFKGNYVINDGNISLFIRLSASSGNVVIPGSLVVESSTTLKSGLNAIGSINLNGPTLINGILSLKNISSSQSINYKLLAIDNSTNNVFKTDAFINNLSLNSISSTSNNNTLYINTQNSNYQGNTEIGSNSKALTINSTTTLKNSNLIIKNGTDNTLNADYATGNLSMSGNLNVNGSSIYFPGLSFPAQDQTYFLAISKTDGGLYPTNSTGTVPDPLILDHGLMINGSTESFLNIQNADININSENECTYDIFIGNNTNGGEINIKSSSNINLTATDGIFLEMNKTTNSSNTTPLLIDENGKLTTLVSSKKFKKNINKIAINKEDFLNLKPVSFFYENTDENNHKIQFGLIAEDLLNTSLDKAIIYDKNGDIFSINYNMIFIVLLDEYIKLTKEFDEIKTKLENIELENTKNKNLRAITNLGPIKIQSYPDDYILTIGDSNSYSVFINPMGNGNTTIGNNLKKTGEVNINSFDSDITISANGSAGIKIESSKIIKPSKNELNALLIDENGYLQSGISEEKKIIKDNFEIIELLKKIKKSKKLKIEHKKDLINIANKLIGTIFEDAIDFDENHNIIDIDIELLTIILFKKFLK
jgi:hypothetical protein